MPVDIFPQITIPVASVIWQYTGLSTPEMKRRVTTYGQYAISSSVNGIKDIEAEIVNGISVQKIYFQPDVNLVHNLWTSAAPAMINPLYAEECQLSHATITATFAIYPIIVVAVLVGFGDVSDNFGRRTTMLLGLGASLIWVLLFAVAPSVFWPFVARAFMGLGVGPTAGASTAAAVEFS